MKGIFMIYYSFITTVNMCGYLEAGASKNKEYLIDFSGV